MAVATLIIGNEPVSIENAWVHLKSRPYRPVRYTMDVPQALYEATFDPRRRRSDCHGWAEFLWRDLEELGTFVVETWFRAMAPGRANAVTPWHWVIATVDEICESEQGVRLRGRAERFEPGRFA